MKKYIIRLLLTKNQDRFTAGLFPILTGILLLILLAAFMKYLTGMGYLAEGMEAGVLFY